MRLGTVFVTAGLLSSCHAWGDTAFLDEDAIFQNFPVVLTASRLHQPMADAPSALTVIDGKMIKASGARNIAELFRLVPGIYVDYHNGNTPIVSLRNSTDIYARRMQVLVDGRSIYLPPTGGVEWAELPVFIDDIERIEVVRGPSAASHGTNSLFGVINIITRDPAGQQGSKIALSRGQFGISDAMATLNSSGAELDLRLSAGYRSEQEGGIRSRDPYMAQGSDRSGGTRWTYTPDMQIMQDGSSMQLANLRLNYHPSGKDSLSLSAGYSQGYRGAGILGRGEDPWRNLAVEQDYAQLDWLHVYDSGDESRLSYARSARRLSDNSVAYWKNVFADPAAAGVWQPFQHEVSATIRDELELENILSFGDAHRVVWGGGVRSDIAWHTDFLDEARSMVQYRLFGHEEWRISERWLLNVGSMLEWDSHGDVNHSPRASLNLHLTPQQTLRVAVSAATRHPVLGELYMQDVGVNNDSNPWRGRVESAKLNPERILSRELAWLGNFSEQRMSMEVRAFQDEVSGMVADNLVDPSAGTLEFANLTKETITGVDGSAKYHWDSGFLYGGYAWQTIACGLDTLPNWYNDATIGAIVQAATDSRWFQPCARSVARHSASLLLSQDIGADWQISSAFYLRSPVSMVSVNPVALYPEQEWMRRLDLRLARTLKHGDLARDGEVAVVLQNATQDAYTLTSGVPERVGLVQLRRLWLTLTFNY